MIPSIGGPELIILLVIVLLLFGAKRIPELAKGLGTGIREFKKGTSGDYEEVEEKKKNEEELDAAEEKPESRSEDDSAGSEEKPEQKQR